MANPTDSLKEIAFSSYVGNQVRAAVDPSTTVGTLDHFTVWAYVDESDGVVFNGELVEKDGTDWGYVGARYWAEGHNYRFFALSPYGKGSNVTVTGADTDPYTNGLGVISFENVNGTEDVLYASNVKSTVNSIPEKVTFQFNHLLSKVKFTFTNGHDGKFVTLIIKDVKMEVPATASVDLDQSVKTTYEWVNHDGTTVLEFGNVLDANHLELGDVEEVDNERLTIPAGADQKYKVTFTVQEWQNKKVCTTHNFETYIEGKQLVAGTSYNFTAAITPEVLNLKKIVFDAKVDSWENDTPEDTDLLAGLVKETVVGQNGTVYNKFSVEDVEGFESLATLVAEGKFESKDAVVLKKDIDLSATRSAVSNITPIGTPENPFCGTFDGNGYSIKNLNIVETEAKEGKAYLGFFGYAENATIKNVVFENVSINVACLDIDHSQGHIGAVAGSLEGTSTIENVTVKGNIFVEATTTANGASRVAVVAGGNAYGNVTMKNVHVVANDGSYLKANNNTGAIAGQLQGKTVYENCSSNIDVTVNKFYAGGIVGLAGTNDVFTNCHTTGNIAVVAGREGRHNDEYRVGGIAGGWADGKKNVLTLVNCSYTGNISGKNSDGTVVENFDYMGYVGRGYTLTNCAGSKVIIDGTEFVQKYDNVYGVYTINGLTPVATADELIAALEANEGVLFMNDIKIEPASMSNAYGATGINVKNGQTIDGGGYTLNIKGAGGTWDSGINTTGGLIKNLTVTGSFRGIFINHTSSHSEKVVLENVTLTGVTYTLSCDQGLYQGIEATNCSFYGWTSFAKTAGEAKFVDCYFGAGNGYKYCRPYSNTEFVGCTFCPGYTVDTTRATVTFTDCTFEE